MGSNATCCCELAAADTVCSSMVLTAVVARRRASSSSMGERLALLTIVFHALFAEVPLLMASAKYFAGCTVEP